MEIKGFFLKCFPNQFSSVHIESEEKRIMKIREVLLSEANELSELALHSKATWNYSEEFILACKEDLTITEEYIKK